MGPAVAARGRAAHARAHVIRPTRVRADQHDDDVLCLCLRVYDCDLDIDDDDDDVFFRIRIHDAADAAVDDDADADARARGDPARGVHGRDPSRAQGGTQVARGRRPRWLRQGAVARVHGRRVRGEQQVPALGLEHAREDGIVERQGER